MSINWNGSPVIRSAGEARDIPIHYFLHLIDYVAKDESTRESLLTAAWLSGAEIDNPDLMVSWGQLCRLLECAQVIDPDPLLGLKLGLRMTITAHGMLGYAALSSRTLGEALEVIVTYFETRTPLLALQWDSNGMSGELVLRQRRPLGSLGELLLEIAVGTLVGALRFISGGTFPFQQIDFRHSSGVEPATYQRVLGVPVLFQQPSNRILFPRHRLDQATISPDAGAHAIARARCEEVLRERVQGGDLAEQIRARLRQLERAGFPTQIELARELALSPRTLTRRLAQRGIRYQSLVEEVRRESAIGYLKQSGLSVNEIAYRLGYADPSNFGHAFRRWFGTSPTQYREQIRRSG